jgi:hypothetical protein
VIKTSASNASRIVVPAPRPGAQRSPQQSIHKLPPGLNLEWAPAWFYSALNWLGKVYYDANHAVQSFNSYMAGSDVDPYAQIGSTRLFLIIRLGDQFRLSIAPDAGSIAPGADGTFYPNTDEGIREMYLALAASSIFASIKYCYVPGRIDGGLYPAANERLAALSGPLQNGYDPATGLRAVVLGSAVSQVVPVDDFIKRNNEQIYNPSPVIVPIVSALVYDLSKYNALGATTFTLPTFYTRDRMSAGTDVVSRAGQTVVFAGGPGFEDASATALKLENTSTVTINGTVFTTFNFDKATVVTTSQVGSKAETGIAELTYSSQLPSSVFSNQQFLGFYRDNDWTDTLGIPIWDYGVSNTLFTAKTEDPITPVTIFDPASSFLNGGSLQNVVQNLRSATYLYAWDILDAMIQGATTGQDQQGVGLAATAAALDFAVSPSSANAPIVDKLDVPILATVTTTPVIFNVPVLDGDRPPIQIANHDLRIGTVLRGQQVIGGGGNTPKPATPGPVTVQAALSASIPREALDGTHISSIESGTVFPDQPLGAGVVFQSLTAGTVINLMERHNVDPAFAPFDLPVANLGVTFREGVSYVLALSTDTLSVRGSDGFTASVNTQAPDAVHTFVGSMVYGASTTSVRLYPKLWLPLQPPAVGTQGVLQGETYSIRFTYGGQTSSYDLLDSNQVPIARQVSIASPQSTDNSSPRPGDLYFGSFTGGDTGMSVWSVPVFLTVAAKDLPGAGFEGTMSLEAQVSGVPAYALQVTDSSLFVFSNLNVDTRAIGSVSNSNVFVACAVINSSPDDTTSKAFAPTRALLGLVRQVRIGSALKFVFVSADDSVVIGSTRYMLSVIELDSLDFDPSTRPYPPAAWPSSRYWQFANKHDPYLDVQYTGETQTDRIAQAQQDTQHVGKTLSDRGEPIHMYLDTNPQLMQVWPIVGFPFDWLTQTVDASKFRAITDALLSLIAATPVVEQKPNSDPRDAERITLPADLALANPYAASVASTATAAANFTVQEVLSTSVLGKAVTNLSANVVADPTAAGAAQLTAQSNAAELAVTKALLPGIAVTQNDVTQNAISAVKTVNPEPPQAARQRQVLYGFSVYNPATGEGYLIELVPADQDVFDQLPRPTKNLTYDPYYVRVVFLKTLMSYNMTIIVPAMVHDQYGHFARQGKQYQNLLAKTDELNLGYVYSLFDTANTFDTLTFGHYPFPVELAYYSETALFTNIPYSLPGGTAAPPDNQLLASVYYRLPPPHFVCRRKNWSADCHLMQATHDLNSAAYFAFGAGDIVPLRLDAAFQVDKRAPAHLYKLTYTFADRQYQSAKTILVANTPHVVAVTTGSAGAVQFMNFSISSTAGSTDLQLANSNPLQFPTEVYVVGQASSTLLSISDINAALGASFQSTGDFLTLDESGQAIEGQQFALIPYNNLVYMVRAVSNNPGLGQAGGLGTVSGLLIDTFVPATTGNLALAQGARHKRSGLQFFGATYTPTTMVDTLDNLDFNSITGDTFYVPTIFIPIPELDATTGFIADISNFLGQQFWTFVYPEIVAHSGDVKNGVTWDHDVNIDAEGKPVLSLQKLHFVYDPQVVLFTPNDLSHKYALQPKQQVLALTNGQIQEGICWRSANVQPQRLAPTNICAQQILPDGPGMDRPNIIYSSHNREVITSVSNSYMGMSVNSFLSVSGTKYNIEESALQNDQTGSSFISQVSSVTNMVIGVLFDYDNDDLGTSGFDLSAETTKGVVFLNGYLSASGYAFSSPDHFDVNDVLPSQVPLLEQIADTMGFDVAFFNTDVSLPRQFWSLTYDTFTAAGVPNFIPNVPSSIVDPGFTNRTRSLILSLQNPVHPEQLGMMDTYSSVISANLHLKNGVTGSIFLSKKADRDVASIGTNPVGGTTFPLFGLPTKYDFFIFSRDHYWTLKGAAFELIDHGYAMCLIDDGTGTGNKVAKYYIDADGNYYELYSYVLYSPNGGVIETQTFPLRVTLGAPGDLTARPIVPETPNNVNPQDLAAQINKLSTLIYAAFGPSIPGQPPAFLPIQAVGGAVQAAPIVGPPGFNGYSLNVAAASRQPVQISQIYSGTVANPIAGSTTITPINTKTGAAIPFYGSISHGLDRMLPATLTGANPADVIPRPAVPPGPATGLFGGNGLGSLIATPFSCAFQGSGAVPPAIAANPTPGTTMRADDTVFYTYNAALNTVMDSFGKQVIPFAGQYFVDATDPLNPIYATIITPIFLLNGNLYSVNLSTTLADGVTSRYTLNAGGRSYPFDPDNMHVTADRTRFTFNPINAGAYTVSYASIDAPAGDETPSPIPLLAPFIIAMGGKVAIIDVFNNPGALSAIVTGVMGRQYDYDPIHGRVTIHDGANTAVVPVQTGLIFPSTSGYGYVIAYDETVGGYTVNGAPMFSYSARTTGDPAAHALMTAPQMFTVGSNFCCFDRDTTGAYVSVTGNRQTYPVNPYQFSINGTVYIINTNVQPNTVIGGGNTYPMSAGNTQFVLNGVQYTITLKAGSLNGATISGQFNITQGNVVILENFIYQIDTLNGQLVGNGATYPLTTSGVTYTISTSDRSFTVTTEPNSTSVTIGNIVYQINNTTVVGDGIVYPILVYRTFADGAQTYNIGFDGVVSIPTPFALSGVAPFSRSTFTDGATTYTVNDLAAFDGTDYFLITGSPAQFSAGGHTYTLRNDAVSIAAGAAKTLLGPTSGPLSPNQFSFGTETIFIGRATDVAAFDGQHYYAIANGQFTDSNTGNTFTISGNTAVHEGNSYEIFSNLGGTPYFKVPNGPVYYINIPVADTGNASGDIFNVFPVTSGGFTMPLRYTITVAGGVVTLSGVTFTGGPTAVGTLTATGSSLTGGFFVDPVTKISYACLVNGAQISFIDSNNTVYAFPAAGTAGDLIVSVVVATHVGVSVDDQPAPAVYPVLNNQFIVGGSTYTISVPVAYTSAAGPYFPMVNGRFIVPNADPISDVAYTIRGANVIKGYVVSTDDEFSVDGNVVYTINAVNVVKATNQATLAGGEPNQTLTVGALTYALDSSQSHASIQPAGVTYNTGTRQFTATINGTPVTYTVGATSATDNRNPQNTFTVTSAGSQRTFTDLASGVTFTFDSSGNNPVTAQFPYTNHFFIDAITGVTYFIDEADNRIEAISYIPEIQQYSFAPADGNTYLIHYNDVRVEFPVISGANVNAGIATVGANQFIIDIDRVNPLAGGPVIPINRNSFEMNGDLYTISGSPAGADYSACTVIGEGGTPRPFVSPNTFRLTDPSVTYTLHLDSQNLPILITATFPVRPSRDLINVNDDVYIITYNTVTSGSLLGQGQAIPIVNSGFTLPNRFDSTQAKFTFADLDIFNAASVVGVFTVYLAPTFFIGATTYTLDPVQLIVTDNDKRPYPLIPNPTMFSINGFNYVIDTNRLPHAIIGNNNISPLSTDVTVESGQPIPNSTFTLNGQIYAYVEDAQHNLLAITGTKSFMISQPALTFKLDSSLVFTLSTVPPAAGNFPGSVAPLGTVSAGPLVLNISPGTPESGGADFFTYKNVLYTLVKSEGVYVAVQKSYTVYASAPAATQQQLAVFNLNGATYLVTDGTTQGDAAPAGINPGTMWAATATSATETQFGLVYGFSPQPVSAIRSGTGLFQFQAPDPSGTNTLYDVVYTAGSNANVVRVDVPALLPTFTQTAPFAFTPSYPLTFETGGYNAFTTFVEETSTPSLSFAAAYKTPVTAIDPVVDSLIAAQGDFSLEFWHSIPASTPSAYHPFTYSVSTASPLVRFIDVDFEDNSNIYVEVNDTVVRTVATPPVFSSGWRHVALTYEQPYTMLCQGGGFEVKKGDNFNFNRDFSVAMTFSVTDVNTSQGLVYKGTGSDNTTPELAMSYRIGVSNGSVTLQFFDADDQESPLFIGPAIQPNQFFQLIVVKKASTPVGQSDGADPYPAPFDTSDLGTLADSGMSSHTSGFPSGGGDFTISKIAPAGQSGNTRSLQFLNSIQNGLPKSYDVTISVRQVNTDGSFGAWTPVAASHTVAQDSGLAIKNTGFAHLLIGAAFADDGAALPLGNNATGQVGNIRNVYLFNTAINRDGILRSNGSTVDIANATSDELAQAGLIGIWVAEYDPNGLITNPYDPDAFAVTTNQAKAVLAPLTGHEREGVALYVNGYPMTLSLVSGSQVPASMTGFTAGNRQVAFNAGLYRMCEISMWNMVRQQYQVVDDMFGRLIPSNEPFLSLYLSGSFQVTDINAPILPMNKFIDNVQVQNQVTAMNLVFTNASLDLAGCPAVGRCGPLISPNLYTPPGVALTVCDTPPDLTTYSVTLNTVSTGLAGVLNEAYVYVKDNVLTLYAGKKIGDLVLSWVSQEQGDVQLIGYVEGAPPAPMANLTNRASYAGATSLTLSAPTSVTLKLQQAKDNSHLNEINSAVQLGPQFGVGMHFSPFGFGMTTEGTVFAIEGSIGGSFAHSWGGGDGSQTTSADKLDELNRYTVKLHGAPAPVTGDQFMSALNSVTTQSTTAGTASSKTAILPNPNLGGFTASNPPAPLPRTPADEKFGNRMFVPSPYGQAFVTSQTLDVYQQTLLQTNTVFGFVRIPNTQIPPDINIVSFRINSQYLRPGVLDGVIGYTYNPATLPTGAQTFSTSTGEMEPLYDKNFSTGEVGHDASYMRIVEAYKLKRQIDQEAFTALALYRTQYDAQASPNDSRLTPGLDVYNEYVWTARGGTQEIKHTYTTTYDEVFSTSTIKSNAPGFNIKLRLVATAVKIADLNFAYTRTSTESVKMSYNTTGTSSFDISASFDGIEGDTQMRYASNNDAHFVMKNNSMFNQNNQSGLNLVVGSDGLVYNVVPNVSSGAGLPTSNNLDDSQTYMQPQPAYTSGNANGITGALEPYDRPGKVKQFRTYAFFLQPREDNADTFWDEVIDPVWLANSNEADARAMRDAANNKSIPWRILYRVTYCERFLPPVSTDAVVVPQITPVMAVPVLDAAADFLYKSITAPGPRPANNPLNDIEANIVLVAPTQSGASAGSTPVAGQNLGAPAVPNNVIPFDLMQSMSSLVNWGDSVNSQLLSQLTTSVLGMNTVPMVRAVPGSTKLYDVMDPVDGVPLYSVYQDPNGLTVNVQGKEGITVYQDVNGNPVQYYDGKTFTSLQADYVASPDGTVMYYVQPPSTYDQSVFDLNGDYDLFGHPGDEWRYYLVSGMSANMTSEPTVTGTGPFLSSGDYKGFSIAPSQHASGGAKQVKGYILVQGILQWPHLNTNSETFADVQVYKAMSLLDTFPIGDPEVLISFLKAQYPEAPFVSNDEINLVFARNIVSYFNGLQQALMPQ